MNAAELRREAREAETRGDHPTAALLRERDTEPPPAIPVANLDLASMRDADLEMLAEAVAGEMVRRGGRYGD